MNSSSIEGGIQSVSWHCEHLVSTQQVSASKSNCGAVGVCQYNSAILLGFFGSVTFRSEVFGLNHVLGLLGQFGRRFYLEFQGRALDSTPHR